MQQVSLSLFILLADSTSLSLTEASTTSSSPFLILPPALPALEANDPEDKNSPFYYDWHSLRVGGLICAGILCAIGIIVLMSGKCKCKFSQKPSHRPGDTPPLVTPGSAHNC